MKQCIGIGGDCSNLVEQGYYCQECEDKWTEIVTGYWVVTKIWFTHERKRRGYNVEYPYWFTGHYKNKPESHFFWGSSAKALTDREYDFSNTLVEAY